MNQPRTLRVGVIGFGWMGQAARASLGAAAPATTPTARCGRGSSPSPTSRPAGAERRVGATASPTRTGLARPAGPRRPRRGQRLRAQLRAPRDRGRGRRVRASPVDREARRPQRRGHRRRSLAAVEQGGGAVRGGLQLPQRARPSSGRGSWWPTGRLGDVETVDVRLLADYSAHPDGGAVLAVRPRARRHRGARRPGQPRLRPRGVRRRRAVGDQRAGRRPGHVHPRATRGHGRGLALRPRRRGPRGPVGNEDHAAALLRFASGARGYLMAAASRWASSAATASRCAAPTGRCVGLPADGRAAVCIDQDYQDARGRPARATPATASSPPSSRAAGVPMGYDDLKVVEARGWRGRSIAGEPVGATIEDALRAAELVDAMQTSITSHAG